MNHLMKLFLVIWTLTPLVSMSQDTDSSEIKLTDLTLPTSPAFMLLDRAPTSIERPDQVKAFALSIVNQFSQNNGLPQNYAIEFSPYWLLGTPKEANPLVYAGMRADQNGNYKNAPFAGVKRATLSFAFMNDIDSTNGNAINNVAVGARTSLLRFYPADRDKKIVEADYNAGLLMLDKNKFIRDYGATAELRLTDKAKYDILKKEAIALFQATFINFEEEKEKLIDAERNAETEKLTLKQAIEIKPSFAVDIAAAYNQIFFDNSFSQHQFGRFGAWVTANYSQRWKNEKNYSNLYLLGRYVIDGTTRDINNLALFKNTTYIDYGLKVEIELDRASISYENIKRISANMNFKRSVGTIRYKLNDKLYFTAAFGQNFGIQSNLVALLGMNLGFLNGNENLTISQPPPPTRE